MTHAARYLLDTNIVSDLVRHPHGEVARRIREVGEARVCTSIIVAAELRYGAMKKGSHRLTTQLDAVLSALDVLPLEAPADAVYGRLRARLEQAVALGYTIVTDNEQEFARIEQLARENWLRTA